ncbi:putative sulfoacetate transporter SauU [mine drainage metagenome]|uniref:Putative sulfoacetate transporter SauU n=1 Tax=mine drainage metagenome TaxID=410659 RepID=A0A1J5Q007_9ZZZZ
MPAVLRHPPVRIAMLFWTIAALAYMVGFFLRVTPGVLNTDLMRDFHLNAAQLGNLASFYFYFYAASQIPTGIANDRYGPKALIVIGQAVTGIGALLFAVAGSFSSAAVARALIGLGHGVAWVSLLELSAAWFAPRVFGTMSGLSLALGTLGAVLAQAPLLILSHLFGWRWVLAAVGVLCLALSLMALLRIRNRPEDLGFDGYLPLRQAPGPRQVLRGLGEVWRFRNTALLFIAPGGVCGAFLTFTTLWGMPFLVQQRQLSPSQASWVVAAMLVAFSVGGVLWGRASDRMRLRKRPYLLGGALMLAGFGVLVVWPQAPSALLLAALLLASLGSGSMVVGFAWAKESVPQRLAGTASGVHNTGVMLGALVQLPLLGWVLDLFWQGQQVNGVRLYGGEAFQAANGVLLAWIALSVLSVALARETHAKSLFATASH